MNPWRNFAISFTAVISFTFVFQALPPILRLISRDLDLGHTQSGLLMSAFALPGVVLTIAGGRLADRLGIKLVGTVSLIIMLVGALGAAAAIDFWTLLAGRVLAGIGGLVLVVAAGSLISQTFSGRQLGIAMGFYGTALPLGTILGFGLIGLVSTTYGWRAALASSGLPALIPLVLLHLLLTETGHGQEKASPEPSVLATLQRVWPMGLIWLWFNAGAIGFITFAPEFLVESGLTQGRANFIASSVMWGALVVSPIVGLFLTDIPRKATLIITGALLTMGITALFPAAPDYLVPLVIILGLAAAVAPPALFALPADLVGPKSQGVAFGIMSMSLNVGVLLGPSLIGLARDQTGTYTFGFYLMSGFFLLAALSALPLFRAPGRPDTNS